MNDTFSTEKRSWVMSKIKSKDTKPEMMLRRNLWAKGYRYRKNAKDVPGHPDILFSKAKLAIFVDGRFWHGKKLTEERLSRMSLYWQTKIKNNIDRDARNNEALRSSGYTVLRFTDLDIEKDLSSVIDKIEKTLSELTTKEIH